MEIISTKQGSRMKSGIRDRRVDISVLLEIKTKLLANANASALATVFETASRGHKPSNWVHTGLFCRIFTVKLLLYVTKDVLSLKGIDCHFQHR